MRLHPGKIRLVQGTPDDAEIRRVLAYVVQHDRRFDPDVRLDSLDALRAHTSDPQVLSALCDAAVRDSDPAVRLKAWRRCAASAWIRPLARRCSRRWPLTTTPACASRRWTDSRQRSLRPNATSQPPDGRALNILRDRVRNDPNNYVRLHSASVLSQLTSLEESGR